MGIPRRGLSGDRRVYARCSTTIARVQFGAQLITAAVDAGARSGVPLGSPRQIRPVLPVLGTFHRRIHAQGLPTRPLPHPTAAGPHSAVLHNANPHAPTQIDRL
jgi:hypothetical protein